MSGITLANATSFAAQFVVMKGQQVLARIASVAPNAQMLIPTGGTYEVAASTIIEGNTHTTAPQTIREGMGFLAQVFQHAPQGSYEFDLQVVPNPAANTLAFQKTCLGPVTFSISKDGLPLQIVVVKDSNTVQTVDISDVFNVYAVVDGVTTATVHFTSADATVTAVISKADAAQGHAMLVVSHAPAKA